MFFKKAEKQTIPWQAFKIKQNTEIHHLACHLADYFISTNVHYVIFKAY